MSGYPKQGSLFDSMGEPVERGEPLLTDDDLIEDEFLIPTEEELSEELEPENA